MANRSDLPAEVDATFDGSGIYAGPWIDSAGILRVRCVVQGGTAGVDESSDQTNVLRSVTLADGDEVALTARYFRLVGSGAPSATFRAVLRAVG